MDSSPVINNKKPGRFYSTRLLFGISVYIIGSISKYNPDVVYRG